MTWKISLDLILLLNLLQEDLGADIVMQLDHVIHVLREGPIIEEAMERSIRFMLYCF